MVLALRCKLLFLYAEVTLLLEYSSLACLGHSGNGAIVAMSLLHIFYNLFGLIIFLGRVRVRHAIMLH